MMRKNRWIRVLPLAFAAALAASGAGAEEAPKAEEIDDSIVGASPAGEAGFLETPPFPGLDLSGAFRGDVGTLFAPGARAGSADVSLVRSQLGARVDWPVHERLVLRIGGRTSTSRYRFDGDPKGGPSLLDDLDLYAVRLSIEGSFGLDVEPCLAESEIWSLLGSLSGRSRWEDGDFGSGLDAAGAFGVGYAIPDHLRLGLGFSVRSSIEEGGLEIDPFFSLRWEITERFTLRTHDLGLRLEYDLTPALEIHASGARTSDSFRLHGRAGVHDDLAFRDRHLRFAGGVDWKISEWLRLDLAIGSTAERRLRVSGEDLGTIVSQRVDPSIFLDVRLEVRL